MSRKLSAGMPWRSGADVKAKPGGERHGWLGSDVSGSAGEAFLAGDVRSALREVR